MPGKKKSKVRHAISGVWIDEMGPPFSAGLMPKQVRKRRWKTSENVQILDMCVMTH